MKSFDIFILASRNSIQIMEVMRFYFAGKIIYQYAMLNIHNKKNGYNHFFYTTTYQYDARFENFVPHKSVL